ncbi:MAG: hypothetical protein WCL39_07540 [Armatimonadota bacterium]
MKRLSFQALAMSVLLTISVTGLRQAGASALVTGMGSSALSKVPATMELGLLRALEPDTLNDVQNAVIVKVKDLNPATARLAREVAGAGPLGSNATSFFKRSGDDVGFWIEPDVVLLFKYTDQSKLRMAALHVGHLNAFRVVPTDSGAVATVKPIVPSCHSGELACLAGYLRPLGTRVVVKSQCPITVQEIETSVWQPVSGAPANVNRWLQDLARAYRGAFTVGNVNEPTPPVVTLEDGRFVNHPSNAIPVPPDVMSASDVQFKLLLQYNFGIRDLRARPSTDLMWCVQIGSTD